MATELASRGVPLSAGPSSEYSAGPEHEITATEDPMTGKPRVSWRQIDGACAELIRYSVTHDNTTASSVSLAPGESTGYRTWCKELWKGWASTLAGDRTLMHGFLWKLNSGVDPLSDPVILSDINQWRRRLFFVQRCKRRILLTYISEKDNGVLDMACYLTGRQGGKINQEPLIEIPHMGRRSIQGLCDHMLQYDVAFADASYPPEDYEFLVPKRLYPFSVSWKDSMGVPQRLLLAASNQPTQEGWFTHFKRFAPKCLDAAQ